jgi:hypothetical protein
LYQALYTPRPPNTAPAPLNGAISVPVDKAIINLTLNSLKKQKPLAKLLVLAKRKQAKHEFQQQQAMATEMYVSQLWTALDSGQTKTIKVTELIHHVKQSLFNATTTTVLKAKCQ